MKYVYFGSSEFSKTVLEFLCDKGYKPSLIVSKPDKPKGRGLHFSPTEVSSFAQCKKISLIKPQNLKSNQIEEDLTREGAVFFMVADYGQIIPDNVLNIPEHFSLCVHPSLLPNYRGAAPIEYAIMNGEVETGVTIFKINSRVDAGDILLQKKVKINPKDDFFSLSERLAKEGAGLLIKTIDNIVKQKYTLIPQNENSATLTSKLKKEDGRISWRKYPKQIRDLVRATVGWPSAYTHYKDITLKILDCEVIDEDSEQAPGVVVDVSKKGIDVIARSGVLRLRKVKPQGKKEMDAWSFVCGHRIKIGDKFL